MIKYNLVITQYDLSDREGPGILSTNGKRRKGKGEKKKGVTR